MKNMENTEDYIPEYIKLKGLPAFVDCENIWVLREDKWDKSGYSNCIMKNTAVNKRNSRDWCPAPTANEMLMALPRAVDLDTSQDELFYLRIHKVENDRFQVDYYKKYSRSCFSCIARRAADAMVYVYNRLVDVGAIQK